MSPRSLLDAFAQRFGRPGRLFRAPGRVNLIGEHTDYNEGFVLPFALEQSTWVAAAPREDELLRACSLDLEEEVTLPVSSEWPQPVGGHWGRYVQGMATALVRKGVTLRGADLLIHSDVPLGAGLSSSAALELSVGSALLGVAGQQLPPPMLAHAGQQAEHEAVGIRSGMMDQLTSALGRAQYALMIDCRTEQVTYVPLPLEEVALVVVDTGVKHALATSAYNERRAECEEGARAFGVQSLRDITLEQYCASGFKLDPVIRCRVHHVLTENARTFDAATALQRGNWEGLGALMNASHNSLRDDFQVSSPELDAVVDAARALPGVLGARMTGGGFGGSAIVLVQRKQVPAVRLGIKKAYAKQFGQPPVSFEVRAGAGAGEVGPEALEKLEDLEELRQLGEPG